MYYLCIINNMTHCIHRDGFQLVKCRYHEFSILFVKLKDTIETEPKYALFLMLPTYLMAPGTIKVSGAKINNKYLLNDIPRSLFSP